MLIHRDKQGNLHYLTFIVPNANVKGSLFDYVVTPSRLEAVTGLDFVTEPDQKVDFSFSYWGNLKRGHKRAYHGAFKVH